MNEINLQIINKCQLKCVFCARSWIDLTQIKVNIMSYNTFVKIVDECIKNNIGRFCLTPRIGEVFLDPTFEKKIKYLEDHKQVEYYFFATNLLVEKSDFLINLKKAYIEISLYGYDNKSYLRTTNVDCYDKFIYNLNALWINMKKSKKIFDNFKIFVRCNQVYEGLPKTNFIYSILKKMQLVKSVEISESEILNYNFGGLIPSGSLNNEHPMIEKKGVCPTAKTGCIMPNGDYGLCYMNDVNDTMIMGNIFKEGLTNILSSQKRLKILKDMENNNYHGICKNCNEQF